jgi:hypothetical protein
MWTMSNPDGSVKKTPRLIPKMHCREIVSDLFFTQYNFSCHPFFYLGFFFGFGGGFACGGFKLYKKSKSDFALEEVMA